MFAEGRGHGRVSAPVGNREIADFERDGAVLLRGVIDDEWQELLRRAAARELERPEAFFRRRLLWRSDPDFARFCRFSPAPRMAAALLRARKVNLFMDQLFAKAPGTASRTGWHNDLPYWPLRGWQVATIWIALDPITVDNGALEVIRGSHAWNRRYQPFEPDFDGAAAVAKAAAGETYDPLPDIEAERGRYDIAAWDMRPGDALAFHAMTLHGAAGNTTAGRWRRAYAVRYAGDDVRYHEPATNEWLYNPALKPGDPLDSDLYPVVHAAGAPP